jgi:asparagine synthase (glutamine-hydrolysing)
MKTNQTGWIVLLDGQGGGETLLGYHRYHAAWLLDNLERNGVRGFVSALRPQRKSVANAPVFGFQRNCSMQGFPLQTCATIS